MKRKIISIILILLLITNPILPWMPARTVAAENAKTYTVTDAKLYNKLKTGIFSGNINAATPNDQDQKITIDTEAVTKIQMDLASVTITDGNNKEILETLFRDCINLKTLFLINCDLSSVDFSNLKNKTDISTLYLDACYISDISFIQNMSNLKLLSFGDEKLTDDSLSALLNMSSNLSNLKNLNLGITVHKINGQTNMLGSTSRNKFTNTAALASIPEHFLNLTELDLSGLQITSLQDFANIGNDISIKFQKKEITDFADCENNFNWKFDQQSYSLFYGFARGWGNEIPDILKRTLDQDDPLYGRSFRYQYCSLSPDGKNIIISPDAPSYSSASVYIYFGKLSDTRFSLNHNITIPDPIVPEGLTAMEGDTLAKLDLNEEPQDGVFAWEDPDQDVGKAGNHTFNATYSLEYNGHHYVKYDIEVPVSVKGTAANPTPTPMAPTPTPVTPTPAAPTPTPVVPTPTPIVPTPTPVVPTPTPIVPTKTPTQAPATQTPEATKQPVATQTPRPDESKLTGNQIEKLKDLSLLLATGKQKGSNGIKLTWREKSDCDGYEVYWSFCDGKQNFKKLKTVGRNGKRECIHKKLKKNRAYKYYIATYIIRDGKKNYQSKSPSIHVAMKREKHTNAKRIKVNKTKVVLKEKGSFQIKAKAVLENRKKKLLNHEKKFRYYVDNRDVASVSKKGKIIAKSKGSCTVFVAANNGVTTQIKVLIN